MKKEDIIGWYGVLAVLLAYALVSLSIWETNMAYQILNVTGSLGLMYVAITKKAYQLSAFYIFWAIVALINLI